MKKVHLSDRTFRLVFSLGLIIVLGLFFAIESIPYSTDAAALRVAGNVERRVRLMDKYIGEALNAPDDEFLHIEGLPQDIVVYRYVNDSLQSWCNQFTEINDDISSRLIFSRVTTSPNRLYSPLARAGDNVTYVNMGPKWYLVKAVHRMEDRVTVIAGLEIKNTLVERNLRGRNGVNPHLHLAPGLYNILPLSEDEGSPVMVFGSPVFKVARDIRASQVEPIDYSLFSPLVYADGSVFSSLGVLLLLNTLIFALLLTVYLLRRKTVRWLYSSKNPRLSVLLYGLGILVLMGASFAYIHIINKSVIFNSSLSMEFFRWSTNFGFSLITFLSFIMLIVMTLLLSFCLKVVVQEFTGRNVNTRSAWWPLLFAAICGLYLTLTSAVYGYRKEERKIWTWIDRLAIERDLGLEIQLMSVEDAISSDPIVETLLPLKECERPIKNRITESYLGRISQTHDIGVVMVRRGDRQAEEYLDMVFATGVEISKNSRFYYCENHEGKDSYVGVFQYALDDEPAYMLVKVGNSRETDLYGYRNLLPRSSGLLENGIPNYYSYARYRDSRLKSFRGDYPYPTVTDHLQQLSFGVDGHDTFRYKGYNHYCTKINGHDLIVISRPTRKFTSYFTTFSFIFLISFLIIWVMRHPRRQESPRRNYLRTKINFLVIAALVLTLTAISVVSVMFVYDRNERNMTRLMSNKINTLQTLLEKRCQFAGSISDLKTTSFYASLQEIGQIIHTDITLYTPSGKVFLSTAPEIFDGLAMGSRLNQDAYYNITKLSQRYFIHKEEIARSRFYALYAPIFNGDGDMIAIVNCPYTDGDYDFNREAVMHASLIVCLFFMLVLLSIWLSSFVTNNLFRHISKLSQKMDSMDIHNLEEIEYSGKDEVSGLVEAYNRMVKVMTESSKQLAKAERDSAWSEMARQVAHEIKNSLTPIRLKIQKLQRLRANGSPDWDAKFDETAKVILEQIDVLADTASGFSAIAKLYGEQAVEVDIDKMLSEQTFMFDNRDNVDIDYIGFAGARTVAPQSQLVRVFVNLITNAIQAIEMRQDEQTASGVEPEKGKIIVSLRNSTEDGFYDVVVDDNGTGVKEENLSKLFVPNFTTKSSGTGLGLSICRSIVESCNGTITYSRSYVLGGACFTVKLPKVL